MRTPLILALFLVLFAKVQASASLESLELLELMNQHRTQLGLFPLVMDEGLNQIVEKHSQAMAEEIVPFGHLGFAERCGEARRLLVRGNLCAENVAWGQSTAEEAFTAWMNSQGHKENIELARVTHTGIGMRKSASGITYWTQIFLEKTNRSSP